MSDNGNSTKYGDIEIYYLMKGRAIPLHFRDGQQRTFSPSASVPHKFADGLLTKMITFGGCCGRPQKTVHLFATADQLESGERNWIE